VFNPEPINFKMEKMTLNVIVVEVEQGKPDDIPWV
jgi:hypothetical protein